MSFDSIPRLIDEMRSTVPGGDRKSIEAAAHKIKGNSAMLGAQELSEWAGKAEAAARDGALEAIPEILVEIERGCSQVTPAIEKLLG